MLGKLHYFLDKEAALLVYKQASMPLIDYANFLLMQCNLGYKRDLQILQNNALHTCLRYRRADHVTIEQLHTEAKLQSLERRIVQLLSLMYDCSRNKEYIRTSRDRARADRKVVFDVPAKCSTKFLNSSFSKGIHYWNLLENNVQRAATEFIFKKLVNPMYNTYRNLLGN